jgi:hypothetical protein
LEVLPGLWQWEVGSDCDDGRGGDLIIIILIIIISIISIQIIQTIKKNR